jgi:predicted aspartyl protease
MKLFFPLLLAACLPLAAAHAGEAAPRCTYVDVADLPIRYVGLGLMPAVDGEIDGMPATVLVDTGAFETQLTMNGAARRDLRLSSMPGHWVEGVGGSARLYSTRLKEFGIGPARSTRRMDVLVIGQDNLTPGFDAIAGAPFLLQTDLEIDLRAKQMHFYRQRDCDKTELLLWKEPTVIVPFESHFDRSPNPHFTVQVNGQELDAIIDTGAHHTIMTLRAARRAGIDVDGPGVRRLGYMGGVGSERAPHWATRIKTVKIGEESINNAEVGIVDTQGETGADLFLGQDFLRAHRVLFAMSQKKIYFAYLGGDAFTRSDGMPDWVRAEAESGNPDAGYVLALAYHNGQGVTRDPAAAAAWLHKAAAAGEPHAELSEARQLMLTGHAPEAIPKLRDALDKLPADRVGALWLYLARVRNGEAELAKTELQASLGKLKQDDWPEPIAEFYLGELDAAHLLDQAAKDKQFAHARTCMADDFMAEWHAAHGQQAQADALKASFRAQCGPGGKP